MLAASTNAIMKLAPIAPATKARPQLMGCSLRANALTFFGMKTMPCKTGTLAMARGLQPSFVHAKSDELARIHLALDRIPVSRDARLRRLPHLPPGIAPAREASGRDGKKDSAAFARASGCRRRRS